MPLQFEFPVGLTADQFIAELSRETHIQSLAKLTLCRTYYDSFDWRLYSNGIACEHNRTKGGRQNMHAAPLILRSLSNGRIIAESTLNRVPAFAKQFEQTILRDTLAPLLEMRALLPVCSFDYDVYSLNIINTDEKVVLRLSIEAFSQFNSRVTLQAVKGYDKTTTHIAKLLTGSMGFTASAEPPLLSALHALGRKPKDYSSKLNINLPPDMRADIAGKYIYSHLLKTLKVNEAGTIADTDSEFLHDFRVAVRRTRAGLSQIKGILPANINAYFSDFFSWLGQITGPTRDFDVYLLNFDQYKNSLPDSIQTDLDPLQVFLLRKQKKSQKALANNLQSAKYMTTLSEWEQFLKEPSYKQPLEQNATLPIKVLADRRIWKIYHRVMQAGEAITDASPDEALHDLRKFCKKLRYMMEFFQSLYPEPQIKYLIKQLKSLQEVLGDFQDFTVQEQNLKLFSEEMIKLKTPANTFLAMGVLIQNLDALRREARKHFSAKFEDFKQEENRSLFKLLFAPLKLHGQQH